MLSGKVKQVALIIQQSTAEWPNYSPSLSSHKIQHGLSMDLSDHTQEGSRSRGGKLLGESTSALKGREG